MKKGSSLRDRVIEVHNYAVYSHKLPPRITYEGLSEEERSILHFLVFFFARDYIAMANRTSTLKKRMLRISELSIPLPKSNKYDVPDRGEIPLPKRAELFPIQN